MRDVENDSPLRLLPNSWRKPIYRNGCAILPSRIMPGPMEGITRDSFCQVMVRRKLVDCWITPFIRVSEAVPRLGRLQKRVEPFLTAPSPPIVQIMGCHTARLAETAASLMQTGAAGVDLNCACPTAIVVHNGAGAALLQKPDWIYQTLTALRAVCDGGSVSVKLRAGLYSAQEMTHILSAVQAADVDFVMLHFRTALEMYAPVPHGLQRLAQARELLPGKILIGSGDIFSVEDARRMHQVAGLDGVLAARGLLRNPWLLREMQAASGGEAVPPQRKLCDRLQFLLEIAESAHLNGVRRHGFVIHWAQELLSAEPALIADLKERSNLADAYVYLKQRTDALRRNDSCACTR